MNILGENPFHNKSYTCGCQDGFRIANRTLCVPIEKKERRIHVETTTSTYIYSTQSYEIQKERVVKYPFYSLPVLIAVVAVGSIIVILVRFDRLLILVKNHKFSVLDYMGNRVKEFERSTLGKPDQLQ